MNRASGHVYWVFTYHIHPIRGTAESEKRYMVNTHRSHQVSSLDEPVDESSDQQWVRVPAFDLHVPILQRRQLRLKEGHGLPPGH